MNFQEELKSVEFAVKSAVGGGGSASTLGRIDRWLFLAVGQLGSEAAKRNCHCEAKSFNDIVKIFENPLSQSHSTKKVVKFFTKKESVKLFNLLTKRKLFTLAPTGRESSRMSATNYECERGGQRHNYTDRATECAMTDIGANLLKTLVGWACQPNNETFVLLSVMD